MNMFYGRPYEEWIAQYGRSHRNPLNRFLHTFGIPLILISILLFVISIVEHSLFQYALWAFIVGWIFQFIGHAFEGKKPEFLSDWRFLFIGVRWWFAKIRGRA
jgi:uncharacterized membrane protein YGL010W